MSLRLRPSSPPAPDGTLHQITPESAGWHYVGFQLIKLTTGQRFSSPGEPTREICLVLVTGAADIHLDGSSQPALKSVGGRRSPFENRAPGAVFIPAGIAYSVIAHDAIELAICSAPAISNGGFPPRLIAEAAMPLETRGQGSNTRYIRNILPEAAPAESLLVVEVITPASHWSSYPPHKHDTASPGEETQLEETYYHRFDPPQGFGFQRVYTDDRSLDEALVIEDGDVVLVPRGYHPVAAAHGYDLYYLNVMAGPERRWFFKNDPAHEWLVTPPPASLSQS